MLDIKNAIVESSKQKKQKYILATISACFMVASLICAPCVLQCKTWRKALGLISVKQERGVDTQLTSSLDCLIFAWTF